jgi:hypothetical protein
MFSYNICIMTKSKCFSKCRKVPETLCTHEECRYVNGSQYSYCRLSNDYELDENCISRKKTYKNAKSKTTKKMKTVKNREAAKKIAKFMERIDPTKRREMFLKSICSDSGICIAFGKETKKIKEHFGGFTDFKYVKLPIKRMGKPSENGFVNEITYENNGYFANTILKSSAKVDSDNLMFEYLVGLYINKQCSVFPCFIETYAWYSYIDKHEWNKMKKSQYTTYNIFEKNLVLQPAIINSPKSMEIACTNSKYIAILIQHIKNAQSLKDSISNKFFFDNELLYVLYQVYMPLATLAKQFTHYDLHLDNVLVYEPVRGKYIQYYYVLNDGTQISFKSSYIAKIIDYGRSFFVDNKKSIVGTSKNIYNEICDIKKCKPDCGTKYGFSTLEPEKPRGSFYYISSSKRNMSHDLRLLNEVVIHTKYSCRKGELYDRIKTTQYGVGLTEDISYGTKEQIQCGLPEKIANVLDARDALQELILKMAANNEQRYSSMERLGSLYIYENGFNMKFESS